MADPVDQLLLVGELSRIGGVAGTHLRRRIGNWRRWSSPDRDESCRFTISISASSRWKKKKLLPIELVSEEKL